jgi:Flp pilus assembly pilin Flp
MGSPRCIAIWTKKRHFRRAAQCKDTQMRAWLSQFWNDESAIATIEYALVLSLVGIGAIVAWTAFGGAVKTTLLRFNSTFANPAN